ncbi:MAG: PASTA domain-containing protein [Gemmatimonadales bacterium]|nr:PASTA domain-containing protein [Gemmatimonadales bacterium]
MRARRHTSSPLGFLNQPHWRRALRDFGLILATFVVGYGASAWWLTPGSVLAADPTVPRVLELAEDQARERLTELGFRVRFGSERTHPSVPRGSVVWQDPPPGMVLPSNTVVQLVVSGGPAPARIPDVIGLALPYAEKVLDAAGVRVGRVDTVSGEPEAGVVLAISPPPGNGRPRGSAVDLVVSGGAGESR